MSDLLLNVADQITSRGFFHSRQPLHDGGERLIVCTKRDDDGRLHGNSFWLAHRHARWFLVLWTPHVYEVEESRLVDAVVDCLQAGSTPLHDIPAEIVDRFRLKSLGPEDFPDA